MGLTKKELEGFKNKLINLRDQMIKAVHETTEEVKQYAESKGYSQHQADEGTDDFDKTISLQVSNRESDILKQVNRALEKIEEGTYGICDVTGKEIPKARLKAIPYATMTIEAQEKLEKQGYLYETP